MRRPPRRLATLILRLIGAAFTRAPCPNVLALASPLPAMRRHASSLVKASIAAFALLPMLRALPNAPAPMWLLRPLPGGRWPSVALLRRLRMSPLLLVRPLGLLGRPLPGTPLTADTLLPASATPRPSARLRLPCRSLPFRPSGARLCLAFVCLRRPSRRLDFGMAPSPSTTGWLRAIVLPSDPSRPRPMPITLVVDFVSGARLLRRRLPACRLHV